MADNEERLPSRSYKMIDMLDRTIPHPKMPTTALDWTGMDENALRKLAFAAGYRATVDMLVGLMEEEIAADEQSEDTNSTTVDGDGSNDPEPNYPTLPRPSKDLREDPSPVSVG